MEMKADRQTDRQMQTHRLKRLEDHSPPGERKTLQWRDVEREKELEKSITTGEETEKLNGSRDDEGGREGWTELGEEGE